MVASAYSHCRNRNVTPKRRYYEEAEFNDKIEMDAAYGAIAERAKSEKAIAIITINIAREKGVKDEAELDSCLVGSAASRESTALPLPYALRT